MNVLPMEKQITCLAALTEGCSIRSVERLTGIHRDTIMRLTVRVGEACEKLHDVMMRDLNVSTIELDEQWSFVAKKQKRVTIEDPETAGDAYLWIALDAVGKAVLSYTVGKRTADNALSLAVDLRERIVTRPQITADGFAPYVGAIELAFGRWDVDFSQLVKVYQGETGNDAAHRYSPGRIKEVEKIRVFGHPDPKKVSTSYVERFNLTTRMQMRRFTRLTNGFSRKIENHRAAIALHIAHYNFCRVHESLRVTPAMQLGVTDHVWMMGELIEAAIALPPTPPPPNPMSTTVSRGKQPSGSALRKLTVIEGGRR